MRLFWYHMSHAPLGILNITLVSGNDVNMHMKNTLTSCRSNVHTDIIAVGTKFLVQQRALLGYQRHAGIDLFGRQLKKAGDMALRDDQCMTRAYPIGITSAERKFTIKGYPSWVCTK